MRSSRLARADSLDTLWKSVKTNADDKPKVRQSPKICYYRTLPLIPTTPDSHECCEKTVATPARRMNTRNY